MSEISSDHVEWAVVDRLRRMAGKPDTKYPVTHAFSLLSPTLTWVVQRSRNRGATTTDRLAARVRSRLLNQMVDGEPWNLYTGKQGIIRSDLEKLGIDPFVKFEGESAAFFFDQLRNVFAHGDARNILPFHRESHAGRKLVGFEFKCYSQDIILLESDMRRFVVELSSIFCEEIQNVQKRISINFVEEAAGNVSEEAA